MASEIPGVSIANFLRAAQQARLAEGEDGFAVEENVAGGNRVVGMAGDCLGERGFAGAVRAHDGVDLAAVDDQREALDDFLFADGDVEIFDFEL